jgi:hypothetical protein
MTRFRLATIVATAVLAVSSAEVAQAQLTGTPVFSAPYRAFKQHEVGGYVSSASNYSLEGFYGYGSGKFDIELRGGFVDFESNAGSQVLVGAQARQRVITNTERFPLDGALTFGISGAFGDGADRVFIPVGLSLGRRFLLEGSKTSFVPYVQPYLGLALTDGDSDLAGGLGLGVDIRLSDVVDLRIGGGIGDIEGVSVGIAIVR